MSQPELDHLHEQVEKAHGAQQKRIGLTTALVAVFLAIATMLGNNANTYKIIIETKTADWWAFTHSNDTNSRIYMGDERLAQLQANQPAADEFHKLYEGQKKDSDNARVMAQSLEKDSALQGRKSSYFETAGLFLEVSIVLCSVALLTELMLFWHLSFVSTAAGVGLVVIGLMLH